VTHSGFLDWLGLERARQQAFGGGRLGGTSEYLLALGWADLVANSLGLALLLGENCWKTNPLRLLQPKSRLPP